jgi:hypothetical protein
MNLTTILLAGGTIGLCMIPFFLMTRSRNEREKKLLQSLLNISNQGNCKITLHEISGDLAIGIAEHDNVLLFFKQGKEKETQKFINLAPFQSCRVNNLGRTIKNTDDNYRKIERLELLLEPLDKKQATISLEFYNMEDSFQLDGELQLVEKWEKIINATIKKNSSKATVQ